MKRWSDWGVEEWGNFVTIGSLFLALALASFYAIRRTWRWDRLGASLTTFFIGLTVLFGLSVYGMLWPAPWLLHIRWALRIGLTAVAAVAIVTMATDEPPRKD